MFFKKGRGRCGCVYGTKGAVDGNILGTTALHGKFSMYKEFVRSCRDDRRFSYCRFSFSSFVRCDVFTAVKFPVVVVCVRKGQRSSSASTSYEF
jgi:hypothetical protein